MAKKPRSSTAFLPFYVFKQTLVSTTTDNCKETSDSIDCLAEAAKEPSWYEFWLTQGNEITLNAWTAKYKDYIDTTSSGETVANKEGEVANERGKTIDENCTEPSITSDDDALAWQELWNEHSYTIYAKQYQIFEKVYENYLWNLRGGLLEEEEFENEFAEIEEELVVEIEEELEQLKLAGLPIAFGKGGRNYEKQNIKKEKVNKIDYLEPYSDSETTSNSDNSVDETESDSSTKMPPLKEKNKSANDNDELHKTKNNAIHKRKFDRPRPRGVPNFMLQEKSMIKYWNQRFSLFSRFDEGIQLDRESWFSVTPEKVARHMANRMSCDVIIDSFCGSGGNTIQFAKTCNKVIAIDIDPNKIEMARHNAGIYGVEHKIEFIVGDYLKLSSNGSLHGDVVFLSPPWGGPSYSNDFDYDIERKLEPVGASKLMELSRKISNNIAFFLPRNSNVNQIIRLAGAGNTCEIEHNYLRSKMVGLTAYYGEHFK